MSILKRSESITQSASARDTNDMDTERGTVIIDLVTVYLPGPAAPEWSDEHPQDHLSQDVDHYGCGKEHQVDHQCKLQQWKFEDEHLSQIQHWEHCYHQVEKWDRE